MGKHGPDCGAGILMFILVFVGTTIVGCELGGPNGLTYGFWVGIVFGILAGIFGALD